MVMSAAVKINGKTVEGALKEFLASLLDKGIIEALIIPRELPSGEGFAQTLIKESRMIEGSCVLSPTMPVQTAKIVSDLTSGNLNRKTAVVLKPCEARAVVELAKFLQVRLDNVYLIGIDCPGTFEVADYVEMAREGTGGTPLINSMMEGMKEGRISPPEGRSFRTACGMCEHPVPETDVVFKIFGYDTKKEVGIDVGERLEAELLEKGILTSQERVESGPASREKVVSETIEQRIRQRDSLFGSFRDKCTGPEALLDIFSACVRCHNCMSACPICYCKECVFKTSTFDHGADQYLRWAERKAALRMPTDTFLFHIIRMTHMATSCIGCGLCDSACPNGLPVATLFRSMGAGLQDMFGYLPGKDVQHAPPVATFKEDELDIES